MKHLVIGLGSMGKRRVRNLIANGEKEIVGLDFREDRREEAAEKYGIDTVESIDKISDLSVFDSFIISVPPDQHLYYAKRAVDLKIGCFIEASVLDDGMEALITTMKSTGNEKVCPSCTLRFHPAIKLMKKLISEGFIGKVSNFSYHSGQYLPDWHPWESIQDFYVSQKETGGCREIVPFELTWLNWVFGNPVDIKGYYEKTIELDAPIDDTYVFIVKYPQSVLGTVIVDVVSRSAVRHLTINGDQGQLVWDWNDQCVRHYDAKDKRWIVYNDPSGKAEVGYNASIVEEMYIEEIENYLNCLKGKEKFSNSMENDLYVLRLLYQLENSNGK